MVRRKVAMARQLFAQKGAWFVIRRAACRVVYPYQLYATCLRNREFEFTNQRLRYFYQRYNTAWRNERSIEIPIFASILRQHAGKRVLEVGNVLSYYIPGVAPGESHTVVDKYEVAAGVVNEDVLTYATEPFDLIVSISTLEHVGWDESPRDPKKVLRAIDNLKRLLNPGGELVVSVPLDYHPPLDRSIRVGEAAFDDVIYLKRLSQFNTWRQADVDSVKDVKFNDPYPGASAIAVCRWRNKNTS